MFPRMFPRLPTSGYIVAETKFASQEAKMLERMSPIVCPHVLKCFQYEKHCFSD